MSGPACCIVTLRFLSCHLLILSNFQVLLCDNLTLVLLHFKWKSLICSCEPKFSLALMLFEGFCMICFCDIKFLVSDFASQAVVGKI